MVRVPRLSKSRFQAGLQCPKHLWLLCHAYDRADAITREQQALFDHGHRVGVLGRRYFAGGALVEHDHLHCAEAVRATQYLLREGFSCIYEAAFEHDGTLVRCDVIVRQQDGTWTLVEVKSSTGVKPEHVTDLGIQLHVARGSGLPVSACGVLHVHGRHVLEDDSLDVQGMFSLTDVSDEVERFVPAVPNLLRQMKQMLLGPCPDVHVGARCEEPYTCRFYGHCHDGAPELGHAGRERPTSPPCGQALQTGSPVSKGPLSS